MIAIVSRKSEPGAGKCVALLNEIHQRLLLIISVTDRTPHLLALEAFPAEWHGSYFFPGSDVLRMVKPFLDGGPNNQLSFWITTAKDHQPNNPRRHASSVLDLPLVFAAKLLQSSFAAYALVVGYNLRSL